MINVSEFNRRLEFKAYDYTQGDAGGLTAALKETITVWGKFEQNSGSTQVNQAQVMTNNNFTATIRYRAAFTTNWLILYEGQLYKINSIRTDTEGYKRYMIIDCSVSVSLTDWS